MNEPPKIVSIAGQARAKTELEKALERMEQFEPLLQHHATTLARIRRANFLALKQAGFTDEQALTLCCK